MPDLTVICGPAGAGKSTYGRELAARQKACFLDSDTVTEPVVRAGMALGGEDPKDRDSSAYRKAFRLPVYQCLYDVARENLPHVDVVMVGPFTTEIRDPGWLDNLHREFRCEVEVVFVTCDEEVRLERIRERANPRDHLKLKNWEAYLAGTDLRPPAFKHRTVST
ncbi:MAG: AAA family ATPase [Akkermansiaceae bacterium]